MKTISKILIVAGMAILYKYLIMNISYGDPTYAIAIRDIMSMAISLPIVSETLTLIWKR